MKRHLRIIQTIVFLMLCCLPMAAQLNGTGYYRFRNAQNTSNYISLANDKFSYQFLFGSSPDSNFGSAQQIGGGLSNLSNNTTTVKDLIFKGAEIFMKNAIHLEEDPDCIDPSTILYLKNSSGSSYNIIGQGTSLLTLTTGSYKASVELIFNDIYATIARSSGSGANAIYTASVNIAASDVENISYNSFLFNLGKNTFMSQAKLGAYYFYDNNGTFGISSSNSAQNAKWYIEPVTHFNVKPEVEFAGKYYTTLCVPFAYKLSGQVKKAYAIKSIGTDGKLDVEEIAVSGGTVAAGTSVLLECGSDVASECKLELVVTEPTFTAAVEKVQYAPAATKPTVSQNNILKGTYFCNEDPTFSYQYNRDGTSTSSTLTLQNFTAPTNPQKYVVGITASGKLGFVTATGTAMPANKAWLEYTGSAELVLPFEKVLLGDVNNDGNITIADVTALVNILASPDPSQGGEYNLQAADVDGNGRVTSDDIEALVNMILNPN
ncbi:MAG: dockerin type I repeat-containing protein [Prevotella sp.]|nr:dockerin type I repeat-containing protein [Prevotella sp.]